MSLGVWAGRRELCLTPCVTWPVAIKAPSVGRLRPEDGRVNLRSPA